MRSFNYQPPTQGCGAQKLRSCCLPTMTWVLNALRPSGRCLVSTDAFPGLAVKHQDFLTALLRREKRHYCTHFQTPEGKGLCSCLCPFLRPGRAWRQEPAVRAPCDPRDNVTLWVSPSPGLLPTTYQRLASPSFDQPPPTPTAHSPGALPLLLCPEAQVSHPACLSV